MLNLATLSTSGRNTFLANYRSNFAADRNATLAQAHKALGTKFTLSLQAGLKKRSIDAAFEQALQACFAAPVKPRSSKGSKSGKLSGSKPFNNRRRLVTPA